jgi:hypothetical protein
MVGSRATATATATATMAMLVMAGCLLVPATAYTPPRRTRRAANDPDYQAAKVVADASDGNVVLCRMNLIVEVRSL